MVEGTTLRLTAARGGGDPLDGGRDLRVEPAVTVGAGGHRRRRPLLLLAGCRDDGRGDGHRGDGRLGCTDTVLEAVTDANSTWGGCSRDPRPEVHDLPQGNPGVRTVGAPHERWNTYVRNRLRLGRTPVGRDRRPRPGREPRSLTGLFRSRTRPVLRTCRRTRARSWAAVAPDHRDRLLRRIGPPDLLSPRRSLDVVRPDGARAFVRQEYERGRRSEEEAHAARSAS